MEDVIQSGVDVFDTLANTDLSDVDTNMPVLLPGSYEFTIKGMSRELTKPSEKYPNGGSYLLIELALASEAMSTKDKPLNPGYPLRHTIWLVTTDRYDPHESLAAFSDAAVGRTPDGRRPAFDVTYESYIGQTVVASTKVERERTDPVSGETYPERSAISRFIPRS
jgi:hypothetical protein